MSNILGAKSDATTSGHRFDTLLIDLDGTLVDTRPDLVATARVIAARHGDGRSISDDAIAANAGRGTVRMLEQIWPERPVGELEKLVPEFHAYYAEHVADHSRLFAGGHALLDRFAGRVAAVTNKPRHLTERLFDELEGGLLRKKIPIVVAAGDLPYAKPNALPILHALRLMDTATERAVWLGDTVVDMTAGRGAGVYSVMIDSKYEPAYRLDQAKRLADRVFDTLSDASRWLCG